MDKLKPFRLLLNKVKDFKIKIYKEKVDKTIKRRRLLNLTSLKFLMLFKNIIFPIGLISSSFFI